MGSLTSTPAPTPIVVQQPAPTTATATPSLQDVTPATPAAPTAVEQQQAESEERERGLLSRQRSRFGTVVNGFTGFLEQNDQVEQRNNLLGE